MFASIFVEHLATSSIRFYVALSLNRRSTHFIRDQIGRVCMWNCDTNMHIAYKFRHIAIGIMETIQI